MENEAVEQSTEQITTVEPLLASIESEKLVTLAFVHDEDLSCCA